MECYRSSMLQARHLMKLYNSLLGPIELRVSAEPHTLRNVHHICITNTQLLAWDRLSVFWFGGLGGIVLGTLYFMTKL